MTHRYRSGLRLVAAVVASIVGPQALALAEPRAIDWAQLRGEIAKPGSVMDVLPLSARLGGKEVRIEGYLLPVDLQGDLVYEFMLVPFVGACSHMPQPPANQMVHVIPAKPFSLAENYEPVIVTGTLRVETEQTQFYMIDGVKVVETDYSIGRAGVTKNGAIKRAPLPTGNPMLSKPH